MYLKATVRLLAAVLAVAHFCAADDPQPRLYRDTVDASWIEDAAGNAGSFWYRVDLASDQKEFVFVDAEKGERRPAFDHERLAVALEKLLGKEVDPKKLPFDSLEWSDDGELITLRGWESSWSLDPATYEVKAVDGVGGGTKGTLVPRLRPHPSGPGRGDTRIRFVNQLPDEVDVYWLEANGNRRFYWSLPPDGSRDQHTFAGHAWLVANKKGDTIAVFDGEDKPGVAVIDDTIAERAKRRREPREPQAERPSTRSPDERWEVFAKEANLFLREVATGRERQLTTDAGPEDGYTGNTWGGYGGERKSAEPEVYWSPDSRRLVAIRRTPGSQRKVTLINSSPKDQLQPKTIEVPYLKPGDDVPIGKPHLFDAAAGKEVPIDDNLFANPWSIEDVRWSPDSSEFTFLFNQRGHQVLRVLGVNAATGAVRKVVEETSPTFICYSGKYFCEYLDDAGELIWMSERDGWNHLYLYDAKTGRVKNQITKGEWVVREVVRVDPEKRQIWFRASGKNPDEDPYFSQYYRINFDGTGLTALTGGDGNHSVEFSPDRRFLIDTWSRVDLPPVNELRRADDGQLLCRLEEADASEFRDRQLPEPFAAKGRDGKTDIYGVILRPTDFDPKKKYPVLESIYAGPQDSFVPKSFYVPDQLQRLADLGFVIVQIDGMGTSNRSKAFQDVCWKNLADSGFPDRVLWIKAAAADRPWMDLDRVGIFGTSAGGQSAMRALLDHGDFYKAAVADSGCHDNRMDKIWWNEQWMGWPVDESYARNSNVVDAHKLQGRLLLMVGELDDNVDPSSTMQVVNALVEANKDFELLAMPNIGHGVAGTPYGWKRLQDFFVRSFLDAQGTD